VVLADSSRIRMKIVGPVIIKIHNRQTVANALVLPKDSEPLLGSIPLEYMDLLVDPLRGSIGSAKRQALPGKNHCKINQAN